MNVFRANTPERQAAVHGLAIVGFIALILGGMWLAVYSARFVPEAVNRLSSAAVYLGSVFTRNPEPGLSVVPPVATTTISFGNASSTPAFTSTSTPPKTAAPRPQTPVVTVLPALFGRPDLLVTISATERSGVNFTIKNVGTNVSGPWRFHTTLPVGRSPRERGGIECEDIGDIVSCISDSQQALNPGDSIDYTLDFDRAGSDSETITITADSENAVLESNENNNSISANLAT